MSNLKELAEMFREREQKFIINITIGEVLSISPWRIKYGDNIILEEKHLEIAAHVLNGYKRELELTNVQISQLQSNGGSMSFHLTGSPPPNDYTITDFNMPQSQSSKITATMTYIDTLKVGDRVILVPDNDFKKWFVLDRAVSL